MLCNIIAGMRINKSTINDGGVRMIQKIKDILIGEPLANEASGNEKLNVPFGLAVMSSDAISSVAYAAQEILIVVAGLGAVAYSWVGKTAFMIICLLLILTISYMQIIKAYPQGGGAYVVAKENIGIKAGLIAGAALAVDYTLTVAVSSSAGVAAIISAFPSLYEHRVLLVLLLILVLTILNLRGVGESSKIFSIPTYIFIISMLLMIAIGIVKHIIAPNDYHRIVTTQLKVTKELGLFLILKAFSSGCSALTGIEAVSNAVPNFKEPCQKHAKIVLFLLAVLIFFIFGGSALLTHFYHAVPDKTQTVIAQIAFSVFGKGIMYYIIQFSTALILVMACNTAFTGFPMLMYVIAKDGYAPRQFTIRGQRLSFSTGIIFLTSAASILAIIFKADVHLLIPLYSVGVFLSFTLAQTGMVIHWNRCREKGWKRSAVINGFGAIATLITAFVVGYEKFTGGAWIVIIVIPILVKIMLSINRHYKYVAESLREETDDLLKANIGEQYIHHVIVPIASLNKSSIQALKYARSISCNVIALNISTDKEQIAKLQKRWELLNTDIILVTKYSKYRAVITPLIKYITDISRAAGDNEKVTIVLSEFITHKWWGKLLHNHSSLFLRQSILYKSDVTVATCSYHINDEELH